MVIQKEVVMRADRFGKGWVWGQLQLCGVGPCRLVPVNSLAQLWGGFCQRTKKTSAGSSGSHWGIAALVGGENA